MLTKENLFIISSLEKAYIQMYKEVNLKETNSPSEVSYQEHWPIEHYSPDIAHLTKKHDVKTILDYGCSDGTQYTRMRLHEKYDYPLPYLYEPSIPFFSKFPTRTFDMVVCTDVMEHVTLPLVEQILARIMFYADRVVYMSIADTPANLILPNGENAHCTLKPAEWWVEKIVQAKSFIQKPNLKVYLNYGMKATRQKLVI